MSLILHEDIIYKIYIFSGKKFYGGSPYPRKTPKWQKSITCFMNTSETSEITVNKASSSKVNITSKWQIHVCI